MDFTKNQMYIAVGAGVLLVLIFLGYLAWLNNQPPVLAKSEDRDSLTGIPNSIRLNPLRDHSSEKAAAVFMRSLKEGKCREELTDWEHDYRKKYAKFICDSEDKHPLIGWQLVDWEDQPPLRILHYRGKRLNAPGDSTAYDRGCGAGTRSHRIAVAVGDTAAPQFGSVCQTESHDPLLSVTLERKSGQWDVTKYDAMY